MKDDRYQNQTLFIKICRRASTVPIICWLLFLRVWYFFKGEWEESECLCWARICGYMDIKIRHIHTDIEVEEFLNKK